MKVFTLLLLMIVIYGCDKPKTSLNAENFEIIKGNDKKLDIFWGVYLFKNKEANRLNNEGLNFIKEDDYDKAENKFIAAYRLEPDNPSILNNLGNIYKKKGTRKMAMEYYNESYTFSDSTYFPAAFNIGITYNYMREYDKSLEILEYIISQTEDKDKQTIVKFEMANVMIKQNKCSEARNLYENIKVNLNKYPEYKDDISEFEKKIKNCVQHEYKSNSGVSD